MKKKITTNFTTTFTITFSIIILITMLSVLTILFKKNKRSHIYNGKIQILYEDEYILVIYKPTEIAVHDDLDWDSATVVDTLLDHGYDLYDNDIPYQTGVIHRLDVGTSGILVLAKNEYAYNNLKDQFKNRTITKIYHALIQGIPKYQSGTINKPIGVVSEEDNIYGVIHDGKQSRSHYKILKTFENLKIINFASLVEINLETGRTHQIRVHFSDINHPLVGDIKYGSNIHFENLIGVNHQWLHAKKIEFNHPYTKKRMCFNTDYPEDLKRSLYLLSNNKLQK